ncbi:MULTISPECIES: hypothetical protein [unclassified Microcoleus]|uniref:hypothetical protein n=1 Tax=unclassified Microcoleus TaxID=2642155 RepID=UPI002FD6178E
MNIAIEKTAYGQLLAKSQPKPILDVAPFSLNRLFGLFHKKIYLLWNRPKSLFLKGLLTMVQDVSLRDLLNHC